MFCSAVSLISSLNKHSFFQSIIGKEFCFGAPSERCQFEQRRSLLKLSARSSSGTNGLFFQAPQVALSNKYPGSMNYSQTISSQYSCRPAFPAALLREGYSSLHINGAEYKRKYSASPQCVTQKYEYIGFQLTSVFYAKWSQEQSTEPKSPPFLVKSALKV